MEEAVGHLPSHQPLAGRSNSTLRQAPRRKLSLSGQKPPGPKLRDNKFAPSPPRTLSSRRSDKPPSRPNVRLSPIISSGPRPLVPASERKQGSDANATMKDPDSDKNTITPDGGSAGREGRQFTVANVGNNGRIFLRPSVRPANQRYPQPHFVFPATPPSTAGLDPSSLSVLSKENGSETAELRHAQWTPLTEQTSPASGFAKKKNYFDRKMPMRPPHHRRAVSDSTVQDSVAQEGDAGAFKVVIAKPKDTNRPRTAEDGDKNSGEFPMLQVSIPSWRLGIPRFTTKGTPIIRGSSYAPTEEFRSSMYSFKPSPLALNSLHPESLLSGNGPRDPRSLLPSPDLRNPAATMSPLFPTQTHATYASTQVVIDPSMFDALTFEPDCGDRSIVRYSPANGAVTAATPPRLVAEITSPTFLDYELLSDFFLTFRSFLETSDLLRMLVARLRWAIARKDELGMVVRVRTFVAIRHWILNYFVDDFVVDYNLRVTFCELINDFVDELRLNRADLKVQLKIVAELKKCWRRVCALYWDGSDFDASLGSEVPIAPGGIAGHRDPKLDPSFWDTDVPHLESVQLPEISTQLDETFHIDVSRTGFLDAVLMNDERPKTPEVRPMKKSHRMPTSPTSIGSIDVVSCSLPMRGFKGDGPNHRNPLTAHPVDHSSIYTSAEPIAVTPQALTGKRVRAQASDKKNGGQSDFAQEQAPITEKLLFKNAELLLNLPFAGSLVRGNILPPGQAFVDIAPISNGGASRQTTIFVKPELNRNDDLGFGSPHGSAMSSQGMRKLIGSVRRALSIRAPNTNQSTPLVNLGAINTQDVTITNRVPASAIVPQGYPSRRGGGRPPVRIDLLGATISEDFKKAVREDAEEKSGGTPTPAGNPDEQHIDYSAAHLDSSFDLEPPESTARPYSAITPGSKSIVIVDGTIPPEHAAVNDILPDLPGPVDTSRYSRTQQSAADPTPPTTPPAKRLSVTEDPTTPRQSSFGITQHSRETSASEHPPPFVPDFTTLSPGRPSLERSIRTGSSMHRPSPSRPPLSRMYRHKRQPSSRSYRSKASHRRWASFQSGIAAESTIRSFDATTYSGASVVSEVMPPPLRVLRRKPGGDLRGAATGGEFDGPPLVKSKSTSSLATYTESFRSSFLADHRNSSSGYVDVVNSEYSHNRADVFSLGAVADRAPKRQISFFSTHSSKPAMRPSFEVEAQKLAQIPDDVDDDGGVESALLKLEGKYEKKSPSPAATFGQKELRMDPLSTPEIEQVKEMKAEHRQQHVGEDEVPILSSENSRVESLATLGVPHRATKGSLLSGASRESYNSIPLLDRGLTDEGRSKTNTQEWTDQSILLEGPDTPLDENWPGSGEPSSRLSGELMQDMETPKLSQGELAARPSENQSFLDIDSDNGSDISSEMSGDEEGIRGPETAFTQPDFILPPSPSDSGEGEGEGDGEQNQTPERNPPSPPMSLRQALAMDPQQFYAPAVMEQQIWPGKPLPTPPAQSPMVPGSEYWRNLAEQDGESDMAQQRYNVHLPFILAFDSDVLAQQFTLIEKDALDEVDWKELIDMRWRNANTDPRSWVEFLRNSDARGVEVVVARFNIMVKWAISEIVLTQNLEERARCIIKFLHIAAHCRTYRNFATMSQIALALTSNEIARLSKTWALVPPSDMKTLRDLETLVSPTRNFFNIRAEMEGGGPTPEELGCIPFFGIYTHDLLYNAQRPSEIASSPDTAPLINFERCRTAASVVKTLLRLLEASMSYPFQPIEGVTERCLWMGALTDEEIRRHSDSLE